MLTLNCFGNGIAWPDHRSMLSLCVVLVLYTVGVLKIINTINYEYIQHCKPLIAQARKNSDYLADLWNSNRALTIPWVMLINSIEETCMVPCIYLFTNSAINLIYAVDIYIYIYLMHCVWNNFSDMYWRSVRTMASWQLTWHLGSLFPACFF